jgi:DNA helicase-2/ATP-dependent DNA helicase PcrA
MFSKSKKINDNTLEKFCDKVKDNYPELSDNNGNGKDPELSDNKEYSEREEKIRSLVKLLVAFKQKIKIDYKNLLSDEKYTFFNEIFENRQLNRAIEYIDSNVILLTIHAAKGLEWDYVILPDVEKDQFGFCYKYCSNHNANNIDNKSKFCRLVLPLSDQMNTELLEELCVFYVGLTRARKQAYISGSANSSNSNGGKLYCFASLKGIQAEELNKLKVHRVNILPEIIRF